MVEDVAPLLILITPCLQSVHLQYDVVCACAAAVGNAIIDRLCVWLPRRDMFEMPRRSPIPPHWSCLTFESPMGFVRLSICLLGMFIAAQGYCFINVVEWVYVH